MYGCESWTVKKAERRRIDAFELWCWRRLLRVPWTARRSNHSILKISPGISLEGMMLKLKLQYFGHLMWRVDSLENLWCWEGLGAEREGDNRGWDGWMASPTWWTWVSVNSGSWWWTRRPGVLRFMGSQKVGHDWATDLNWSEPLLSLLSLGEVISDSPKLTWASLVAQTVKNLLAMWETWGQFLDREDSLEKEMVTTVVFLPGESHGQRSLAGYNPWGRKESDTAEWLILSFPKLTQLESDGT